MNIFTIFGSLSQLKAAWDAGARLVADGQLAAADFGAFKTAVFALVRDLADAPDPSPAAPLPTPDFSAQERELLKQYAPWYLPQ